MTMTPLERVVSPTPSAKKRLSALQRVKQLGAKLKKSKRADAPVVEEVEEEEEDTTQFDAVFASLDAVPDAPEPVTLAQRIRTLTSSLPIPSTPPPIKTTPPPVDDDGRPVIPKTVVKDPKFIALLSNPDVMNGCVDDGRPSVWAALEALSPPEHHSTRREDTGSGDSDAGPDVDVEGLTGLMLYAPLHPTEESQVELGHIRSVQVPVKSVTQSRWDFLWSVTMGLIKSTPTTRVKTWVPSTTKISFQVLWWGYRLYLPPPVMASLNSGEAEAVKIATTVTTALTWFLSHVSATMVPPALQPAFLLLQKLGPYVGYIGTFIAWIWSTVQGADKGNGVILTATWILPVALIPSAIRAPIPTSPTSAPDTSATEPPTSAPEPPATGSTPATPTPVPSS